MNTTKKSTKGASDFHAGRFLSDVMHEAGHDTKWLASQARMDEDVLIDLLNQPNMEAELFVRMGIPLEPLFFQRVDEMVFGTHPARPMA